MDLQRLVAALILGDCLSGAGAEEATKSVEGDGTAGILPHVTLGLAIFALFTVQILVRLACGVLAALGNL